MKFRDMKIRTQLKIGMGIILVLVAILAVLAQVQTDRLWQQTRMIYERPLEIRRAIGRLRADILTIHWGMDELFANYNTANLERILPLIVAHEISAGEQFTVLFDRYSGDREDVEALFQAVNECRANREEVIGLLRAGDLERARAVNIHAQMGPDTQHLREVMALLRAINDSSRSFADRYYESASASYQTMARQMIFTVAAIFLLTLLVGRLLFKWISMPLKELTALTERFMSGDLHVRSNNVSTNELGMLADAFNRNAEAISLQMDLRDINEEISETLLNANDLEAFRMNLLKKLVEVTLSQVGAYFLLDVEKNVFEPFISIGVDRERLQPFDAATLEGELGHVLVKKKWTILRDIPPDTAFHFKTFAGTMLPREMVCIPIILDGVVRGVICLGSIGPYSRKAIEALNLPWATLVNTVFGNLQANDRTRRLSEALQESNLELQAQQEELRAQAEELLEQSRELQVQNSELERQRLAVEEADRLKSQFLSNMSHELRTPLNSVMALSRVLMMQAGTRLSEEEAHYLEIIERNGKNLLALINDILDLSKIEAGRMEVHPRSFSLAQTLETIMESILPLAEEKGLHVHADIPRDLPSVESDEVRVSQILQNLLSNAVKFTDTGGVTVSVGVQRDKIFVVIADTGIGIGENDLPYIFDEFRQVDGSSSRKHGGTGLGLAIARKAALMLGGEIAVESEKGRGAVFTLTLPLVWKGMAPTHEPIVLIPPPIAQGVGRTVLVVDDEPETATMISRHLIQGGYNTITATSGEEALRLAARYLPFAITLDVVMSDMDGWEVLQRLKADSRTANIPVVVVFVTQDRDTGFALGAIGYIAKPVSGSLLISEIRRVAKPRVRSVLIVDDNELERREIREIVEAEGLEPLVAEDGPACLELIERQLPDVLVLDLMMPGLDGFAVLEKVRLNPETWDLPVIVVTARELTDADRKRLSGNVSSVLQKSVATQETLLGEVKRILAGLEGAVQGSEGGDASSVPRILLVEDNEAAVVQVRAVLESAGYEVHVARGGQEAVDYVSHTIPDGIVLDLMMPEVDGFAVLEKIRGTRATTHVPVLILTAKDLTPEDLARLGANHVRQLVQKGDVDRERLLSKVKSLVVGGKEPPPPKFAPSPVRASVRSPVPRDSRSATVLIVEDNPDNMITIKAVLGNRYRILEATDGETGLRMALEFKPDLVLLDMALPGMDGLTVVRRIRKNTESSPIPVIAMTARAMKGSREEILEAGCDGYISKPIDPVEVLAKIDSRLKS